MKFLYLLLVVLFTNAIPVIAQTYEVSGTVRDGNNLDIPFATVFLLQVADTTLLKGVSADENGRFIIQNVPLILLKQVILENPLN